MSVLLPCFNAEEHLPEALDSLLGQSFSDFEIVAVDDGSEDRTAAILREAGRRDDRLEVIHQTHGGIACALVAACRQARAPLLARMDADDVSRRDRLRKQVDYMREHHDTGVVASRVRVIPRAGLMHGLLRYEAWVNGLMTHQEIVRDLFVESPMPHPTVMMRRESVDAAGGYRDVGWPEDYDLWMRMWMKGTCFGKLPEELLLWRDSPERTSRSDRRFRHERFLSLKEHYLRETFLFGRRRVAVWGAGPVGKRWARRLIEGGLSLACFVDVNPRKIGRCIHGAPVIGPHELDRLAGVPLLVAVGALSRRIDASDWTPAREEIRRQLCAAGFVEGKDFVCIA